MAHKQHLRLQPVARSGSFRSSAAYAELPRRRSAPGKVSSEVTEHLTPTHLALGEAVPSWGCRPRGDGMGGGDGSWTVDCWGSTGLRGRTLGIVVGTPALSRAWTL